MYFLPKNFDNFERFLSLNQKWPESDSKDRMKISKKYSLESVETLHASQK